MEFQENIDLNFGFMQVEQQERKRIIKVKEETKDIKEEIKDDNSSKEAKKE